MDRLVILANKNAKIRYIFAPNFEKKPIANSQKPKAKVKKTQQ